MQHGERDRDGRARWRVVRRAALRLAPDGDRALLHEPPGLRARELPHLGGDEAVEPVGSRREEAAHALGRAVLAGRRRARRLARDLAPSVGARLLAHEPSSDGASAPARRSPITLSTTSAPTPTTIAESARLNAG